MTFPAKVCVWIFSAEVIPYGNIPRAAFCSQGHNDEPKFHHL